MKIYCVEHEKTVDVDFDQEYKMAHKNEAWNYDSYGNKFQAKFLCRFPLGFAYCAPPEDEDDWCEKAFQRGEEPYLDDLLEYQEQVEQAVGELLFELNVMEV